MIPPTIVACAGRELSVADLGAPLPLDELLPGTAAWEVELGFGRGSYLLHRALAGGGRFLGVELAALYFRLLARRAARRGLTNLVAVRGEAQYVIAALLPRGFAAAVHVYFPDPWPKARHQKRRLLGAESVDLVLGLLVPGGRLYFATDHLGYGAAVEEVLASHPALAVCRRDAWKEGPRTNYERKYAAEGRPILRLEARLAADGDLLHPRGSTGVLAAVVGAQEAEHGADSLRDR